MVPLHVPRPRPDQRGLQATYVFRQIFTKSRTKEVADWETWLTQEDVNGIVAAGLNTIRIPLPFWIIEDIVDRSHEPYAQGGLDELVRFFFSSASINILTCILRFGV